MFIGTIKAKKRDLKPNTNHIRLRDFNILEIRVVRIYEIYRMRNFP